MYLASVGLFMRFSQDFIEKVREANNIVDLISQHVQLKKAGTGMSGLCPFHSERTPSFSVSEERQLYHCFGCGASGNVFTFLKNYKGMTFPETIEYLAERAGLEIPKEIIDAKSKSDYKDAQEKQKLMWRMNAFAAKVFHQNLMKCPDSHPVRQYLAKRKLSSEMIELFQIGLAPDEWENLVGHIQAQNAPVELAAELGLIKKRGQGKDGYFDIFRHRLMFPIHSSMGNAIGFGGRTLGNDVAKYINSTDSMVFHKGKVFYGLDKTAKFIRAQDYVIIVEGYMDCIALYQAGFRNVVAPLGTALTADHARLIKRYTKNVLVLFDGDEAGQGAAERSLPILLSEGLLPKGLILENELDPDEYIIKHGPEALQKALAEAPELFVLMMGNKFKRLGSAATDRLALIDEMAPILSKASDPRLQAIYSDWFCEMFGADSKWAKGALVEAMRNHKSFRSDTRQAEVAPSSPKAEAVGDVQEIVRDLIKVEKPPRPELELLNIALMREEYFNLIWDSAIVDRFTCESLREIFYRAEELYRQMPSKFDSLTALLVAEVEPSKTVTLHMERPLSELQSGGAKKLITDCTRKIREAYLRSKTKELTAHLRGQTSSEQLQKLEQIMNIQRDRISLKRDLDPV